MQSQGKHKIVIIGCGNVAWHLAKQLSSFKKYDIFIYNHKANSLLNDFKTKLKCKTETSLSKIIPDAEFYFICVLDKFISSVSKKIKAKAGCVMHTSGSVKLDELGNRANAGVFYPLQTFSKSAEIDWKETPIIIEAKNVNAKNKISVLAKLFSKQVLELNYKERLKLHLAAVMVNNFTNALFVAANDLISDNSKNKKLQLLLPLIKQTVYKLENMEPVAAQTGPAKRNDTEVMKKHLKLLSENKEMQKIYKQLSDLILKQQNKKYA